MSEDDGSLPQTTLPANIKLLCECSNEFCNREKYLRGCKWSPDGTCLLTCSNDSKLRIFNLPDSLYTDSSPNDQLPDLEPAVCVTEGELIYDFSWYPLMASDNPTTCCFASSSRSAPVHLYDAYNGDIRCSYLAYNHLDELVSPHSLTFSSDGSQVFSGYNNCIRIHDISRPGRNCVTIETHGSKQKWQKGIISCIGFNPAVNGMYALGSYSCSVGIYNQQMSGPVVVYSNLSSGVSHLLFSQCGKYLFSGERKSEDLLCWDLRNMNAPLVNMKRNVQTNQRIYFDVNKSDTLVCSGNTNGLVTFWNLQSLVTQDPVDSLQNMKTFPVHNDAVNGSSLHPWRPFLATCSGQWTFTYLFDGEDSDDDDELTVYDNSLRIWNIDCTQ